MGDKKPRYDMVRGMAEMMAQKKKTSEGDLGRSRRGVTMMVLELEVGRNPRGAEKARDTGAFLPPQVRSYVILRSIVDGSLGRGTYLILYVQFSAIFGFRPIALAFSN